MAEMQDHENVINFTAVTDERGETIIHNNRILLQNTTTGECVFTEIIEDIKNIFHLVAASVNNDHVEKETQDENKADLKMWSSNFTNFLIEQVKLCDQDFTSGVKKNIWLKRAEKCRNCFTKPFTATQCESKWKSLKRTYKSILLHNKTSGNKRRYWQCFKNMHEYLHHKPEISPVATCSSTSGLVRNEETNTGNTSINSTIFSNVLKSIENRETSASCSTDYNAKPYFSRKRSTRENLIEKGHKEEMARFDKFN